MLSAALRQNLQRAAPLVIAKSNLMSRIHRRVYMDYVGVRRYGADGMAEGEIRFVGLFTSEAYDAPAQEIPLVRRKVEDVLVLAGKTAGGHSDRRLRNILENYPREELFQIAPEDLLTVSLGILHLQDRPRTGIFVRFDPFDRFVSVMLFLPREGYDSDVRARAGRILAEGFGGWISAYYPAFSDAPLARDDKVRRATEAIEGRASPRKPRLPMRSRSYSPSASGTSLEVACRSRANGSSAAVMPWPSSATRMRDSPPCSAWISIRVAPASMAFSTSSLIALAGRSTTSPAAMRFTVSGGRRRMGMGRRLKRNARRS